MKNIGKPSSINIITPINNKIGEIKIRKKREINLLSKFEKIIYLLQHKKNHNYQMKNFQ